MYPNQQPKTIGDAVRHVHPCGRDQEGIVTQVTGIVAEGDTVSVRTGPGSTVYGPACNWQTVDDVAAAARIRAAALRPSGYLSGESARILGWTIQPAADREGTPA